MQLTKCCIIFYTLLTKICVSKIVIGVPESVESPNLVEAMIKNLTTCYGNQTKEIVFAGKPFGTLLRTQLSQLNHTVVLIDNTTRTVINGPVRRDLRHRLQLFVVSTSSSTELLRTLRQIKGSRWWNHMASFLIMNGLSKSKARCSNASEYLQVAWKMNLLNAKFVCYSQTHEGWIYGYNPYTRKIPETWQLVNTITSKNDHPWSLHKREYRNDGVCHELDFDKTIDLGGYAIRATVKNGFFFNIDVKKSGIDSLGSDWIRIVFESMNASLNMHVYDATDGEGLLDGNSRSIILDAVDGYSDIALNALYQRDAQNYTFTVPNYQAGLVIITQYNSEKSQLGKILSVIDVSSRYGVLLVLIITFIFFKYFRSLNSIPAILCLIRLVCNSSLTKEPKNVPARIYMSSLFIFIVTVQAIYQGQLSSLLTKSVSLPNVENVQDLADQGHKIYGLKSYTYLFSHPIYKGRYIELEDSNCTKFVLRDSSAACIGTSLMLVPEARKLNLHVSRESFRIMHVVFVIREDWPLEERFNNVLETAFEADLNKSNLSESYVEDKIIQKLKQELEDADKFKVITLDELAFAFVMLGVGLLLATATFLVEIGVERIRSNITKLRDEIRILF